MLCKYCQKEVYSFETPVNEMHSRCNEKVEDNAFVDEAIHLGMSSAYVIERLERLQAVRKETKALIAKMHCLGGV